MKVHLVLGETQSWHSWSGCDRSEEVKHPKIVPWFGVLTRSGRCACSAGTSELGSFRVCSTLR